jgi:CRP/FNR family transcriptional regulator
VRGYSPHAFNLRMTRQEIGSYLGLKLETVSRTLSQFQEHGLLSVRVREVEILDMLRLRSFVAST